MVAAWSRTGAFPVAVAASPGASVARIDLFGNRSALPATNGVARATLDVTPVYFVSDLPFEVARQDERYSYRLFRISSCFLISSSDIFCGSGLQLSTLQSTVMRVPRVATRMVPVAAFHHSTEPRTNWPLM